MLCPNVKHNLSWQVNGQLSPCNNIVNFPACYSLQEMHDSSAYKKLLEDTESEIKSEFCTRCWDKESLGLKSKRQVDIELDKIYKRIKKNYLKIDSALGSVCNAACVICGPESSSLWQKYFPINKLENKSEIWEICQNNLDDIIQLDFGGGEPWLNQITQQEKLFDDLIKLGLSKNIKIRYNTNGSLFPKSVLDKLENFRQVEITLSIDDIGDRFEYNRWPLKWPVVFENVKKLRQLSESHPNIVLTINYTVSVFTYLRAEQFSTWAKEIGIDKINYNILTDPKLYSIKNIQLRNAANKTVFDDLVGTDPMTNWSNIFLEKLTEFDNVRNTNWRKTFPELQELI